ncbi:MAG TPA: tetratricopeptide repeat protein [Thermoflexia bacterium]|nr:tetratricopeptide repeat protein [Thermoflexia bacterium]
MAKKQTNKGNRRKAKELEEQGLRAYQAWDMDQAIQYFQKTSRIAPNEPDTFLHLARALARSGNFDQALRALADFMRLEPESPLAERFEQLFASGMDEVEQTLTEKATADGLPIEIIGAAIQMWIEYRITLGREPLIIRKPETWAAALDYTVRKVNLHPVKRKEIAALYGISDGAMRDRHNDLLSVLDVMPCDYRYFTGKENPLDKLVEAAELLEQLEANFQEP